MNCTFCGQENAPNAVSCSSCGRPLNQVPPQQQQQQYTQPPQQQYAQPAQQQYQNPQGVTLVSLSNRWIAFILCFLLGVIGIHRFYVGKIGTGILYIFTFGLFGIGVLVDLIMIACGKFTDKSGAFLIN